MKAALNRMVPFLRIVLQVVLLGGMWALADWISRRWIPEMPGSVLGLLFGVLLLGSGILPRSWIAEGARWLLAEMLLFFIPAVVAVVNYPTLLKDYGVPILVIVVTGTLSVMAVTAVTVDLAMRVENRLRKGGR